MSSGSSGVVRSPSSSSKLSRCRKKSLAIKRLSSSVAGDSDSQPAVKLVVKLSSATSKQLSIVSKTANALKMRYSSIISTRRGSAAATGKSDSAVKKSAVTTMAGCRAVTDCVVSVEKIGSSKTANGVSAAVKYSDQVVITRDSDEHAADNSEISSREKEQSKASEDDDKLNQGDDEMLLANAVSNPDATESEASKENVSLRDTTVIDASQNHDVTDCDVEKQSEAKCDNVSDNDVAVAEPRAESEAVGDEVTVDESDNNVPVVALDDNEFKVVTSDGGNLSDTDVTVASSSTDAMTVASDTMNTASTMNTDERLVDKVEHSNLPSTADEAKSMDVSEGKLSSSDVSVSLSSPCFVTGMNASIESTDKLVTSLQDCSTSEHNMDRGADRMCADGESLTASEENSTSVDKVRDGAVACVSECDSDSAAAADSGNLMSVDETDCCQIADPADGDVVAGILTSGTDVECDSGDTSVCSVSQPVPASTATTTDAATFVSCSAARFPFLEFLVTQPKLSPDNTAASQSSTLASTSVTVVDSIVAASCDSASSACLVSSESLPSSYSVARSEFSALCQISSVTSLVMSPSSQDSPVSKPLDTGMLSPDLLRVL